MPIRKENRGKYPKDWKEVSHRIRFKRARGRCEFRLDAHGNPTVNPKDKRCKARHHHPHPFTGSVVVLTTAHLDHDETNCADENLRAGCQRCHNRWDRAHRNQTAKATRSRNVVKSPELPFA